MADENPEAKRQLVTGVLAAGAVIVVAGMAIMLSPEPQVDDVVPVLPGGHGGSVATVAEPEPEPEIAAMETPPSAPEAPAFDTVRVEPDGSALVAGTAAAGAMVRVLVDGEAAASVQADQGGSFAALFGLPPSDAARLMTLEAELPDGTKVVSAGSVAIAPTTAPVAVASAEPAAEAPTEAPAALLLTEEGAELLQPPAETGEAAANVTIETIAYTPEGGVQLSGQGAGGAFLRLYLDNAELMTLPMPEAGPWSAVLPEVAPGIYTLRADQIGADGKVMSRFETPFKRETPEALAAAAEPPVPTAEEPVVEDVPTAADEPAAAAATVVAPEVVAEPSGDVAGEPVAEPVPEPVVSADAPLAPVAEDSLPPAAPEAVALADPSPASEPAPQPVPQPATETAPEPVTAPQPPAPVTVTVQPGFTLWRIAQENMGEGVMYVQVYEANRENIRNPDLIYPGQVFTIPGGP